MTDGCEIEVGFKDVTLAMRIIQGVWMTSTRILFNQERIIATTANFGGEIEHFEMDVDKSSLAARWLEWKSSASYMMKAKGITSPEQKEATLLHTAGRKLQKETLPEPTGLAEDADVYDKAIAKLDRYFAGNIHQPFERHKFRSMRQETAESIAHFVSRLMRQADFYGFGGTRDTQVRDQLI